MTVRLAVLCLCGAGAYALLRGMPAALPQLVRSCVAVLLLVGGLAWWAVGRRTDDLLLASGSAKPRLRDFLAIVMGGLALECGFLWVLTASPAPLEELAGMIELKLRPQAAVDRAAAASGGRSGSGNWLWEEEGRRVLPRRTNLKPGAKPEVFIRFLREEDAGKILERKTYVRAFALDGYRNGVWSPENPRSEILEADEGGWIRFFGERLEGEILHEIFHGKDPGGRDVVTALQGLRAVRLPEIRIASDGMPLLPDVGGADGFAYMAGSLPLAIEDLKGVGLNWNPAAAPVGGKLSGLAAKAAGEGDVLTKLLNIQSFLRSGYRYSLVTENPDNLDPLENFLFREKRGHCEFFATAGALLAREVGVETRVAYGWAGGEYFKDSLMFVFRAREAHAWVEVKVPGHGWAVMEPTPPVFHRGGGLPRNARAGDVPPTPQEIAGAADETGAESSDQVGEVALGMMAAFGGLAMIAFIARAARRPADDGGLPVLPMAGSRSGYFHAWAKACEDRGLRWPKGYTLKKRLEEMERRPEFSGELLDYHYGVKYEGKLRDRAREAQLTERIRSWE